MMKQAKNIYLIGLMGVGKTTIGKQLAKALSAPFYDSDKEIETNTGVNIPTIFEYEGEDGFRDREQLAITELTQLQGIVLATGGGVVLRESNRKALKENGFVVYLHCSIDKILQRTQRGNKRPLLNTENPRQRLESLLAERRDLYLSCADMQIDTGITSTKKVIKTIIKQFDKSIEVA